MTHTFNHIDALIRRLASVFYRCVIIVSGLMLNQRFGFSLKIEVYYLGVFLYGLFYTYTAYKKMSFLRLLNDFAFITLFIYDKPLADIQSIVFLLLPIINDNNYTGEKRSNMLLIFVAALFSYMVYNDWNWYYGFTLASIFLLNIFDGLRRKSQRLRMQLNQALDEFHDQRLGGDESYKVFTEFLKAYRQTLIHEIQKINNIILYRKYDNNYVMISSARFVLTESIDFGWTVTSPSTVVKSDTDCVVDGISYGENTSFRFHLGRDVEYIIVLIVQRNQTHALNVFDSLRESVLDHSILYSVLNRMVRFFEMEHDIRRAHAIRSSALKRDHDYMLKAIHALHYVKGRLGPVKNYLDMTGDILTRKSAGVDQVNLLRVIAEERNLATSCVREIMERSEEIMTQENPLNVSEISLHHVLDFVSLLRKHIVERFSPSVLKFSEAAISLILSDRRKHVSYNEYGMNIVISEIIHDMKEHSTGSQRVMIDTKDSNLQIQFSNDCNLTERNIVDLRAHVQYLNSDQTEDIFKRKSLGGFMIKKFLKQMEIEYVCSYNENTNQLVLDLKLNLKDR